jgi:hypothetical protein
MHLRSLSFHYGLEVGASRAKSIGSPEGARKFPEELFRDVWHHVRNQFMGMLAYGRCRGKSQKAKAKSNYEVGGDVKNLVSAIGLDSYF